MTEELISAGDESFEEPQEPASPEPVDSTPVEAEPDEVFTPSWLDEPVSEEPSFNQQTNQHGYSPEQIAAYNRQMQAMNQPQQRTTEDYLGEFVRDPQGYMSNVARQEAQQIAYNMMQQGLGPVQQQMNSYFNAQVEMQSAETKRTIDGMYKTFSKDETFKGNKAVRAEMDKTLKGLFKDAQYQARMGNPRGLMMFSQPGFADVALAAIKAQLGARGGAKAPANVPHVESTRPSVAGSRHRELSPDVEAAIERLGPGGRERYEKGLNDLEKYGDFEG